MKTKLDRFSTIKKPHQNQASYLLGRASSWKGSRTDWWAEETSAQCGNKCAGGDSVNPKRHLGMWACAHC